MPVKKTKTTVTTPKPIVPGAGTIISGNRPTSINLHNKTFTQRGNDWYRANGKQVGAKGVGIIQNAVKKRAAGVNPLPTSVGTVTGDPAEFNPVGNLAWQGATGLSKQAVDWLNSGADSQYVDDYAAAGRIKDQMLNGLRQESSDYHTDSLAALRKLGYDTVKKAWNPDDLTTQYGQQEQNQQYDFGGRGLLHSSEFAKAATNLGQGFNDQLAAITTAGTRYDNSIAAQTDAATQDYNDATLAAIRNAVQRRAATYGTLI